MRVEEHFKVRLEERFGYEMETLWFDVKNNQEEMMRLVKNSKELDRFPHLKKSFKKYPNSMLILIENLNICLVVDENQILKTCYTIN